MRLPPKLGTQSTLSGVHHVHLSFQYHYIKSARSHHRNF